MCSSTAATSARRSCRSTMPDCAERQSVCSSSGADRAATPAALALARRGIVANVTGFPGYGAQPAAQRMVDAVDSGRLDIALIWGPQAGYFARHATHALAVSLAREDGEQTTEFAIA